MARSSAPSARDGDQRGRPYVAGTFRSGITIEEHQLEPVARELGIPRVSLLIADDVGLGKTIEAGLVVQEMLLRHRARRVLVVCLAWLTLKWREAMDTRFGPDCGAKYDISRHSFRKNLEN